MVRLCALCRGTLAYVCPVGSDVETLFKVLDEGIGMVRKGALSWSFEFQVLMRQRYRW